MLLHAGGNGEDIGIEDNVFWRKSDFINQHSVSAFTNADLVFVSCSLALFVEGHHDGGGTIFQNSGCVLAELSFAFF